MSTIDKDEYKILYRKALSNIKMHIVSELLYKKYSEDDAKKIADDISPQLLYLIGNWVVDAVNEYNSMNGFKNKFSGLSNLN